MAANFPYDSIAQMGSFDFWASSRSFGLSDEDVAALDDGTASQELRERVHAAAIKAYRDIQQAAYGDARPS